MFLGALTLCEYFVILSCLSAVFSLIQVRARVKRGERERFKQKNMVLDINPDSHLRYFFIHIRFVRPWCWLPVVFFSGPRINYHVAMFKWSLVNEVSGLLVIIKLSVLKVSIFLIGLNLVNSDVIVHNDTPDTPFSFSFRQEIRWFDGFISTNNSDIDHCCFFPVMYVCWILLFFNRVQFPYTIFQNIYTLFFISTAIFWPRLICCCLGIMKKKAQNCCLVIYSGQNQKIFASNLILIKKNACCIL